MAISSVSPGLVTSASIPASKAPEAESPPSVLSSLFSAIQSIGVDTKAATIFLNVAGMLKEGVYAAADAFRSAKSFGQWMQGGATLAMSAVSALSYGLNAFVALDKAGGGAFGLGNRPNLVEGAANLSKLVSGFQNGDLPQVVFSGGKLCALLALSGNPEANAVISMAESMYERYAKPETA